MKLKRALLRSVLEPDLTRPLPDLEPAMRNASPATWRHVVVLLERNRWFSLAAAAIHRRGLLELVPNQFTATFRREQVLAEHANNVRMEGYAKVVAGLRRAGVEPVLLKSAALVALVHPHLLAHGMSDIDFLIPADSADIVARIIREMNFMQIPADEDSNSYLHPDGILLLDYHFRFRLFEGMRMQDLLRDVPSVHPALDTVRVFEPNAMLAHLVFHLNSHRCMVGYGPRWIIDLGYVLRHWSDELDIDRLRRLMPTTEAFAWLLRLVAFFPQELDIPAPLPLRRHIEGIESFTLEEVFRSERVACWPLTTFRGWAKLIACATGLKEQELHLLPRIGDPIKAIGDVLRERRAIATVQRTFAANTPSPQHAPVSS